MTFEECKEKYPIGSYIVLTHKDKHQPFWVRVQNYVICARKVKNEAYPGFCTTDGDTYYFHPDEYNVIMAFPNFKEAEPYISRT